MTLEKALKLGYNPHQKIREFSLENDLEFSECNTRCYYPGSWFGIMWDDTDKIYCLLDRDGHIRMTFRNQQEWETIERFIEY